MKKIVIITGVVTAGKTTTSHALANVLPGWIFIDVWKMKEMFEPLGLRDRTPLRTIPKKAMITIMKEVMRDMGINILVQETSRKFLEQHLRNDLKKHKYQIYSFFLDVDDRDVGKRDVQREKPTMGLAKQIAKGDWRKDRVTPEEKDVVINTSKHSVEEVVAIILKTIHEKKKKHPFAHMIRKSW